MAHDDPLSIRQLQVFVTLVDRGSFTKAARHLGLSQSTVSGHIADLERRLGMRLVGRERSGVTPTGAGEVLLKPAQDALRAERNTRMAAAELSGALRGTLTLGGSTIPSVYLFPDLLSAFHERHEGIVVHLRTGDSAEIVEFVLSGDVDVGVVGIRPRQRGIQVEKLDGDELVLIVPPKHPFAKRKSVELAEVAQASLVLREDGSGTRRAMVEAIAQEDQGHELDVVCQVGSTEAVKAAVRAGLGVSLVSNLAVQDEQSSGALVVVPVDGVEVRRDFHVITRETEDISPAGRAFWKQVTRG